MNETFSTLDAYLRQLPDGLDSFPRCSIKASVIRDALKSRPLADDPRLPAPIRAFLESPPPVSSFVPEVLSNSMLLAVYDVHFSALGQKAAWDWLHGTTYQLLRTPLYRILFAVMSPDRLVTGVAQRWGAFRRGSELVITEKRDGLARLRLVFPDGLHTDLTIYLVSAAFRAALDCSGAKSTDVEVESRSSRQAVFVCRWSR
ncbi:MAG: DUF2378 family protein [Myxococcales bacterium]|nr:DUF2378 family protein [Myxococcales bacterium]